MTAQITESIKVQTQGSHMSHTDITKNTHDFTRVNIFRWSSFSLASASLQLSSLLFFPGSCREYFYLLPSDCALAEHLCLLPSDCALAEHLFLPPSEAKVVWHLKKRRRINEIEYWTYEWITNALFAWLISHGWKYCWLICCERKILFVGWKKYGL